MAVDPLITRIEPVIIDVSDKTDWTFIEVETSDGLTGTGEATLYGQEQAMASYVRDLAGNLLGGPETAIESLVAETAGLADRIRRAVISALEHALWDIRGKRADKPVYALLGGIKRDRIPIYANINRRTVDRSPAGFTASARDAAAAGYNQIKIAPFDGLQPDMGAAGEDLFQAGLERIAASCAAMGPDGQVLVDCHWRLNVARTEELIRQAAALGLYWVEGPLLEDPDDCADLVRLRPLAESLGVRLAGGEQGTTFEYFEKFIAAGVYDVIMPDVKYTGGIGEMLRLAKLAADNGVGFAPHNPTGPLCHIASLHVAAAADDMLVLEHQFDESPLFLALCPGAVPVIEAGQSALPTGPGLGFNL